MCVRVFVGGCDKAVAGEEAEKSENWWVDLIQFNIIKQNILILQSGHESETNICTIPVAASTKKGFSPSLPMKIK